MFHGIVNTLNNSLLFVFICIFTIGIKADVCSNWFQKLSLKPTTKNCLSICNTSETDMATFLCHNECEKLCTHKKKLCTFDKSKIQFGKIPNHWPWPDQKPLKPSDYEANLVESALATISPELMKHISGIYFFEKPKDLFSAGTETSYFENQIIVYKKALTSSANLNEKIIHELGHSLHEGPERKSFSEYTKKHFQKDRYYITADSKFSPEEDFATNFEIYVTNPSLLKKELLNVFNWFNSKFSTKYNLRKCDL